MKMLLAIVLSVAAWAPASAGQADRVYGAKEDGVALPQVVKRVKADYSSEAMRQMIEGTVILDVVVKADGDVGDVTVKQSLDAVYGLDEQAVKAMKQWQFRPGTKDGKAVAVRVDVMMKFTLR
jgi:periplasmic protein TonB